MLKIMKTILEPLFREDKQPFCGHAKPASQVLARGSSEGAAEGFLEEEDLSSAFVKL